MLYLGFASNQPAPQLHAPEKIALWGGSIKIQPSIGQV